MSTNGIEHFCNTAWFELFSYWMEFRLIGMLLFLGSFVHFEKTIGIRNGAKWKSWSILGVDVYRQRWTKFSIGGIVSNAFHYQYSQVRSKSSFAYASTCTLHPRIIQCLRYTSASHRFFNNHSKSCFVFDDFPLSYPFYCGKSVLLFEKYASHWEKW